MTKTKKTFIESFDSMLEKKGSLTDSEFLSALRLLLETSNVKIMVNNLEEVIIVKNKNIIFNGVEITPQDLSQLK